MITDFAEIFKRNVDGSIQIWQKQVEGSKYRTRTTKAKLTEGVLERGKTVESAWKEATGKNIGKSNETTPEQQAISETNSDYDKKLKTGYATTIETVDDVIYNEPMLAKEFDKIKDKLKPTATYFSSPKLDGIRCITTKDSMKSRENGLFTSCPHIREGLQGFFQNFPDLIIDGELYNHDLKDDFNEIVSLVKSDKDLTPEDFDRTRSIIQYHVYDVFMADKQYSERYKFIKQYLEGLPFVKIVPAVEFPIEEAEARLEALIEQGYEGQIIRMDGVGYEAGGKRSKSLIKHKVFDTAEFKLLSIDFGVGNRKNVAGYITCQLPDGRSFKAGIRGNFAYAKKLMEDRNAYLSNTSSEATIRFFKYTPDGIPRFPVCIDVHVGKRNY